MAKRRAKGEGSISKRKDGRWMARYMVVLPDGTKKRQQILRKTKSEALSIMRKEMEAASYGSPVIHDGRRVGEYLDYWLEHIAPNKVRKTTLIGYEQYIRTKLKPAIGNKTLVGLTPMDVQFMINNHIKSGGSARAAQIMRNVLSSALHDAVNRQIINRNVSRLVDVPQDIRKERAIWTSEQMSIFLNRIKTHQFYPIFELYCTYGMRRGEALGLRWCDVDFSNKTINIRQQLIGLGRHIFIGPTKTNAGTRSLPLLPHIETMLAPNRPAEESDALIFQTSNGTPYQPNNVFRFFRKKTRELGLPEIALHDIRHSVATMMKDNGVPVKDAQMTLGHASPTTTMLIYQHSDMNSKNNALTAISANIRR